MILIFHSKWTQGRGSSTICPVNRLISRWKQIKKELSGSQKKKEEGEATFTCWLGKADVLRVSCVSSVGFLLGTLKIKAA
jgi:hypothetical protein